MADVRLTSTPSRKNPPSEPGIGNQGRTTIGAQSASALVVLPRPSVFPQGLLDALWFGRSVRAQLLLVFILIDIIAVLAAGSAIILRARMQTRVEVTSSMRLAESLVGDAVRLAHQEQTAEQFLASLPAQLQAMRHVRFVVRDAAGVPIVATSPGDASRRADTHAPAPDWFAALVAPLVVARTIPVAVDDSVVGQIEIIGEPADEIAEVWGNVTVMGIVAVLLNGTMIGILYVLFGRVLDPLSVLADGLSDLECQTYSVRLPRPQARELSIITEHFNALASALESLRAENLRLNRRLITAQDDERRRTALELHDEVGPCLFGLKANASSIANAAENLPAAVKRSVTERLHDILSIAGHLQAINRSMLARLRPMALGHVPLEDMLDQLIDERSRQHTDIAFSFASEGLLRSYGDSIDLTVYRCIQESVTNALRHADAKNVTVKLIGAAARLALTVSDDGRGLDPSKPSGIGTRGIRERVEGLGGRYLIESRPGCGTEVRISIPLAESDHAPADGGQLSAGV
jgi:two-component system sensor histidine kinase UhpB